MSGFYLGQVPRILITDLDMLKEILVKYLNKFMDRPVSSDYTPLECLEVAILFKGGRLTRF